LSHQRLFVSDLHLSAEQPAPRALFLRFLRQRAPQAMELYILGDLFDSWIGDDEDAPEYLSILQGLTELTRGGVACFLMRGNRDFLLGRRLARATGCRLLPDPSLMQIADQRVLLMHGDLLCTDDIPYQRLRRRLRNPIVEQLFLWQGKARRRQIAADYRQRSRAATATKSVASMDVNPSTVEHYLRRYRADRLIHGHTHRPADHAITIDGRQHLRQVLADWNAEHGELLVEERGHWWRESHPAEGQAIELQWATRPLSSTRFPA
jgi:UDP-2,3-diacylglucosamine hydrolase